MNEIKEKILKSIVLAAQAPLGVKALGGVSFLFFGIFSFFSAVNNYFNPSPEIIEAFNSIGGNTNVEFGINHFKAGMLLQMPMALFFAVAGGGILLKREWGRKMIVYFSFLLAFFILVAALLQPKLIVAAAAQMIVPGTMILYFTNKKTLDYFLSREKKKGA